MTSCTASFSLPATDAPVLITWDKNTSPKVFSISPKEDHYSHSYKHISQPGVDFQQMLSESGGVYQESANFFCKEPDSKSLRFCRHCGLCQHCSTLCPKAAVNLARLLLVDEGSSWRGSTSCQCSARRPMTRVFLEQG